MESHIRVRYSDKELEEFDELIDEKLKESRGQLQIIENQINALVESPEAKIKGLDDGVPASETERLSNQALRISKHILHLENAKLRIQNKTYGVCRESGNLISKARLRAVPHATLSIEAKQNQSRR